MITNANFAHFLLQLQEAESPITLSFYNYIKYHTKVTNPFGKETLCNYIDTCLSFNFWRQHRSLLNKSLCSIYEKYPTKKALDFSQDNIHYLCHRKVFNFEYENDIIVALKKNTPSNSQVLKINNHEYLQVQSAYKKISVRIYSTLFIADNGTLKPAPNWRTLHYDKNFKLDPYELQQIKMGEEIFCSFHIATRSGAITNGRQFEKMVLFKDDETIIQSIKLNIKAMEQYYLRLGKIDDKYQNDAHPA